MNILEEGVEQRVDLVHHGNLGGETGVDKDT